MILNVYYLKKPIWKVYISYNSNDMMFLERQSYIDSKKISGCQGLVKENEQVEKKIFRATHAIIMVDIWHDSLSKSIECTPPRLNLHVNCGLWVTMMYQYRFLNVQQTPLWWRRLMERGCACVGMWGVGIWKPSVLSTQFCYESKLL